MKCEEIRINLPEYIDGKLKGDLMEAVELHLESCHPCKEFYSELKSFLEFTGSIPDVEPPVGMEEEFLKLAEEEMKVSKGNVARFPGWLRVAAMFIFAAGTFIAGYLTGFGENETKQLRSEVGELRQKVLLTSLREMSGPEKIDAVYSIKASGIMGDDIVNALVYTMNSDKNVNVRLAAILALSEMINDGKNVKRELINSLALQDNPLLQISLIQVLTTSGVKEARKQIESISEDVNTDQNVKEFAQDMIKTII